MKRLIVFALAAGFAAALSAQKKVDAPVFSDESGAIRGYDPVAYFTEKQPVKGQDEITYTWNEAEWHFATIANRDSFSVAPEKYAPQYGGYCAYGWAQGYAVKIEPEAWAIVNNKLYLNYDSSIQKKWNKKQAEYIKAADKNWTKN